jgi:uncharacterized membrane protein YGL010W
MPFALRAPRYATGGQLMFFGKTWGEWIAQYETSHQNPVNRICHTIGIPLIALSIPLFVVAIFVAGLWPVPLAMFGIGWIFQFVGHAVEGKPPEFFKDWRYLFVGLRWWIAKMTGKIEQPETREA